MTYRKFARYTLTDGRTGTFSPAHLKTQIWKAMKGSNSSQIAVLEEIAEATNISVSTLKHWLHGHNSPSDFEKVEDLASYFHIQAEELLEFEKENETMKPNEMAVNMMPESKHYESEREAVGTLYSYMVFFIENYRTSNWNYLKLLHMCIMQARWNLPKKLHEELHSFFANYLQLMFIYGSIPDEPSSFDLNYFPEWYDWSDITTPADFQDKLECGLAPWWPDNLIASLDHRSEHHHAFYEAVLDDCEANMIHEETCDYTSRYDFSLVSTAYSRLEEILKDYLPQ